DDVDDDDVVDDDDDDGPGGPVESDDDDDDDDDDGPGGPGYPGGPEGIRLTMNFSGSIWNDQSENVSNGIKETGEGGIKGVEVFLYDTQTLKQVARSVTNAKGKYKFKKIPVGLYYIAYTYDGQTYITVKKFVQGGVEDYKTNANSNAYANVSVMGEVESTRDAFNNKFNEITKNIENPRIGRAISKDKRTVTELRYNEDRNGSYVITRDSNTQIALGAFQMRSSSEVDKIFFPNTKPWKVNGIEYLIVDDIYRINMGLAQRERTDENLRLDVYQTTFSIKGQRQSYIHSLKDIRNINSNKVVAEYVQKVNPDDYRWRLSDYDKYKNTQPEAYKTIHEIYGSAEECELETYIEYMIVLRNAGLNDIAHITELADYYDTSLEYRDSYRDFKKSSWIVIRKDDDTEDSYSGANEQKQIKWSKTSKYGDLNKYADNFNKIYADLDEYGLVRGEYAEIHLIFRVLKDEQGNVRLDSGAGKQNVAEINGYRTEYGSTGKVAGLIDIDSKPGDVNPLEAVEEYEDDEDRAPSYKLELGYTNAPNGGNGGDGTGTPGGAGTGSGTGAGGIGTYNGTGYGNTIEGNVWEDIKDKTKTTSDGRYISNGIKEENEPKIDDVKVELIEIIRGKGKVAEVLLEEKTVTTGNQALLTKKAISKGAYRFSHLTGGEYRVRFTYGLEEQLEKDIKYNGQDYQARTSSEIMDRDKLGNSYSNAEIVIAIDNSNSMNGTKMNLAKTSATKLIEQLRAKLPGIKIAVVNFNNRAYTIGNVGTSIQNINNGIGNLRAGGETAIGLGIEEGKGKFTDVDKKVMVIITDGQETVQTEEDVIRQIETLRTNKVELISILTGKSENIFGIEGRARYGEVYELVDTNSIYNKVVGEIYEKIIKDTEVEKDRSLGRDIEGDLTKEARGEISEGTRAWQMNYFSDMNYTKGAMLDIETINGIADKKERKQNIKEIANKTWMKAETKHVMFSAGNIGEDKIHEVNQALIERPRQKLELTQEITSIKVTLSDGKVIIDTEKGLNKNVMGLGVAGAPVSIYMDEEVMMGAEVEVRYKLFIENAGEVDMLSNYFAGGSNETITTSAKVIYMYLDQNLVYRAESQGTEDKEGTKAVQWETLTIKEKEDKEKLKEELSDKTVEDVEKQGTLTLRTEGLKEVNLYPKGSAELKLGNASYRSDIGAEVVLSRLISPEDDESTSLTYDSSMEITVRGNRVGRRVIGSVPGNHREIAIRDDTGARISVEADEAASRKVLITKPLGENRNIEYILYIVAGLSIVAVTVGTLKLRNKRK
ncbi:MAG: VWA domain-containing protein, partial [Clostridia bacterium]|nr:VWA domain-containing protein [Clostridia bacterium]